MSMAYEPEIRLERRSARRAPPDLAWWRSSPVKPGMNVKDATGAHVGRVTAVALGADGEVEAVEVKLSSVFGLRRRCKRVPAERLRLTCACVVALLFRAEFERLPDVAA